MTEYQGHRSWNAWNVSLYIANEEPLYREAVELIRTYGVAKAARRFMRRHGYERTPDGAIYNHLCVLEALKGLEIEGPTQ